MTQPVNVLLVGGGGREHALARALRRSPLLGELYITHPENPGLAALGKAVDVPVNRREIYRLKNFCEKNNVGLVVIGPEDPLAEGFADELANERTLVFGPTAAGAQIEANKAWCKALLRGASVPVAEGRSFTDPFQARATLEGKIKDDKVLFAALGAPRQFETADEKRKFIQSKLAAALEAAAPRGKPHSLEYRARAALSIAFAGADTFRTPDDRAAYIDEQIRTDPTIGKAATTPLGDLPVIKASGLAKGKGVVVPSTYAEALAAINDMMIKNIHGEAGREVLIEERLSGPEASVLAITDGHTIVSLPVCQDHKRLLDGDRGPNTGGMGVFCPAGTVSDEMLMGIERDILVPTVDALKREKIVYRGVLYAGLMLTPGGPKVLEYNCRFGDPETQPLMARLKSDLLLLMLATCRGKLEDVVLEWDPSPACCVVLASEGYPEKPRIGLPITGVEAAERMPGVTVDHAGTRKNAEGALVTNGGRVLCVTGVGPTLAEARARAYAACEVIRFDGKVLRGDIGSPPANRH
ncbi:MAG: phosphoribosylamine--glycine ligase [bacterium]|nr:phosphoribosylamine--glycine ligase [bacterium]